MLSFDQYICLAGKQASEDSQYQRVGEKYNHENVVDIVGEIGVNYDNVGLQWLLG